MSSLTVEFPSAVDITNITNANPAVVTTVSPHGYQPGIFITIFIPYRNSMPQIMKKSYLATILSPTTFSVPVDSTNFTPFTLGPFNLALGVYYQTAQAVPTAEFATTLANAQNVIGPNNP